MPRDLTVGRLLLEDAVPPDVRPHLGVLNKKGISRLVEALAAKGGDEYRRTMKRLTDVSTRAGFETGGYSFGPEDMAAGPQGQQVRDAFQRRVREVLADRSLSPQMRDATLVKTALEFQDRLTDTIYKEHLAAKNPLALQVDSGAKGKAENLKALVAGDTLYTDQNYNPVPVPVTRSFAEGVTPEQFFAGTFGARLSLALTKLGTAQGGWLSKRLGNMTHRLVVTDRDGPEPDSNDPPVGYPVKTSDPANENAFLAHPAGGYPRNTHLTADVLGDLRKQGVEKILVRSPLVGGPPDGGVYGLDVGVRERGIVAPKGDHVGRAASESASEPLTQMLISSKHCLKYDTLVRMADWSTKRIDQVQVGDLVLGSDMTGNTFPTEVVNVFDNGPRECHRVSFGVGKRDESWEVEATLDHKILGMTLMSSCKEAAENNVLRMLPLGKTAARFFAMAPAGFVHGPELVAEPRALLMGLLLGDGCYVDSVGTNVYLSCADPTLVDETRDYLAGLNLKLVQCQASDGNQWRLSQITQAAAERDPATGRILPGLRNPARLMLEEFGLAGKYSYEKNIPDAAFRWDNASVAALLSGLMITDGSVYQTAQNKYPFVNYASTSRVMVEQFRQLAAWRFGLFFGPINENDAGDRRRTLYGTNLARFDDVRRFGKVLGLYGVKRASYATLVAAGEVELANTPIIGRAKVEAPFRLKRRETVAIGIHPTFDIQVSTPDHLFVLANGLIVSNSGGVAGATGGQAGFPVLERMFSVPAAYPGGVTHAQTDGLVTAVREAPQGGHYVTVDGEDHHVAHGHKVLVQPGDKVEAGDALSDGVLNPRELVHHKGVGEARRAFVDEFMRVAAHNGFRPDRRNVELIARGYIDHVRLDQEHGEYAPGEVASYTAIAHDYAPREGHVRGDPKDLVGHYLERPALHYTIGCFDAKTEALTTRGWVPWPEVRDDERFATVRDGHLVFESAIAVVRGEFRGQLCAFSGRYIDYAVTPNHRMYVSRYHSPDRGFFFTEASQVHGGRFRVPQFGFPQTVCEPPRTVELAGHHISAGDYAELLGWWVSEGDTRVDRSPALRVYQSGSANPDKLETILELARRLPFKWHQLKSKTQDWGVSWPGRDIAEHFRSFGTYSHNKRLPRAIFDHPPEVLRRTFTAMMAGDGSYSNGSGVYTTTSAGLADDFQELCVRMGIGAVVHRDPARNRPEHKTTRDTWRCGVAEIRTIAQVGGNGAVGFSRPDYAGLVYCAEMSTGLLYVRRNGKPMLIGNSRITPKVAAFLGEHGVTSVVAHKSPPPFTPVLVRSNDALSYDRDWMTQGLGSGVEKNLLTSLARGAVADPAGTSFVPALAEGVNFGSPKFKSTGWQLAPGQLK